MMKGYDCFVRLSRTLSDRYLPTTMATDPTTTQRSLALRIWLIAFWHIVGTYELRYKPYAISQLERGD